MSDLLKIVYDVAAVRGDYLRLHRRLLNISASRLFHKLARRSGTGLPGQQDLDALTHRLEHALDELTQLKEEDLAIRRGSEIQRTLRAYTQALSESLAALSRLLEMQQSPPHDDGSQSPAHSQAIKVAYDDAVQYHNRLGSRLNNLLTTH